MPELISEKRCTARKVHHDDCAEWLQNTDLSGDLDFSDLRAIARAKQRNWKILPGQQYLKQFCKYDGEVYTFKGSADLIQICLKVGVWDDL